MMFKHNIKIAWRNLMKYKLQTLISIVSLAIGMYLFSVAGVFLLDDYIYDRNYPNPENTYVVKHMDMLEEQKCDPSCIDYIKKHCPEVKSFTVFETVCQLNLKRDYAEEISDGDTLYCGTIYAFMVDKSFQDIYGINVIEGRQCLNLKHGEIALSKSLSAKMYPDGNALGQVIHCEKDDVNKDSLYKVVAIFEDRNQHETFLSDALIGGKLKEGFMSVLMVRLKPGTFDAFEKKLKNVVKHFDDVKTESIKKPCTAVNVRDLHSDNLNNSNFNIHYSYICLFLLLSVIIITCALFNYITMLVARLNIRQRELALRYVNGAKTSQLIWLIVAEMIIILGIAYFLASIFDINKDMYGFVFLENDFDFQRGGFLLFSFFVIAVSLIVTSVVVACCNKKQLNVSIIKKSGITVKSWFYRINVCVQFIMSLSAIFATFTLSNQLKYLSTSPVMGRSSQNIVNIFPNRLYKVNPDVFTDSVRIMLDSVKNLPGVEDAGVCLGVNGEVAINRKNYRYTLGYYAISSEYFSMMHIQLIKGEFFCNTDTDKVVISENSLLVDSQISVGDTLDIDGHKMVISGIVKDEYSEPKTNPYPIVYIPVYSSLAMESLSHYEYFTFCNVAKLKEGITAEDLQNYIKSLNKDSFFYEYYISDESARMEFLLTSEYSMLTFLRFMVFASVLLAISGVYGIVSLSCERRRKEIAIRQIHGAKFASILRLFLSEYVYMLLASAVIVFPIGYYLANKWASEYVKQAPIQWWVYPAIFLLLALVIFLSVFWQIYKTTRANPADVMKNE